MKKVISIVLILALVLSLCACGGDNTSQPETSPEPAETSAEPKESKATVFTNEGKTVEVSAEDLFTEFDGNEARFLKLYGGATIEFEGTVKYIKVDTDVYNGKTVSTEQSKIVFEEGWSLIIGQKNTTYDLADFYPGQKLKVSTGIVSAAFDSEFLQQVADNNRVVWLIGNDTIFVDTYNSQTTTITVIGE